MVKATSMPSFDIIRRLEGDFLRITTLKAALELDVFTIIDAGYHNVRDMAATIGCNERGIAVILNALCSMGLIVKSGHNYQLSPTANAFLVRGKPTYYGRSLQEITLSWAATEHIAEGVRTGHAVGSHWNRPDVGTLWAGDFAPALLLWPAQANSSRDLLKGAGLFEQVLAGHQILDLACGSGVKSFAIAQMNPDVRITALDLYPEVLAIAASVAEMMGVKEQVDLRVGDILKDEFGTTQFDIVFCSSVLYFFPREQVENIFARVYASLKRGGIFLINHVLPDEERCSSSPALLLAVQLYIFHEGSYVYSFSDYRSMLEQVGFTQINQYQDRLVSATKL